MKHNTRNGPISILMLVILVASLLMLFASAASGAESSAANAGGAAVAAKAQPDGSALQQLVAATDGQVVVSQNQATGVVGFLRITGDAGLTLTQSRTAQAETDAFLQQYGSVFGITNASTELVLVSSDTDSIGMQHRSYQQMYQGVPVFAGILRVHLNSKSELTAANGVFVPGVAVNTVPSRTSDSAAETALSAVMEKHAVDGGSLSVTSNTLYVYRDGLIQGVSGPNYLVHEVQVTNGRNVRDFVYVDAHTGKIVNQISAVNDGLHRELYEQSFDPANLVWEEGDDFPGTLNEDQANIVDFSGDSYWHFFNAFGRDSYDANGAFMRSVNNDPTIACPNANWNGTTTNYCNGVTSDDVVAHEWGHAYTQYTSDLIYQWQSGALNESYSDIWGETIDMLNGKGTDAPAPVRTVNTCSIYTDPIPTLTVNAPPSIAGDYAAAGAAFGPQLDGTGVTGNVVLADDGAAPGSDACTPLVNGGAISGNVALVDRGTCAFTVKVKNAQDAGATAVIVANNVVGPPAPMGGADPTITIPSVQVSLATGNLIKSELANGVNATMHLSGGSSGEDSYRWLMGEDSTAFGGAIRDMWTPTCMGDPGKVTDAEYHCATTDAGGVHSNSGIPNHAYSLMVDGGTFNGQTVDAIGLVKAAHIHWRAQEAYLTQTSNFADHADALEASCSDLIGVNLEGLSTTPTPAGPSGEVISAADCDAVSAAIEAVEFRTDPAEQCAFEPLLDPNAPALCTTGEVSTTYFDDFESGLGDWTLTNQGVFSGWPDFDWEQDTSLPGGRPGAAAFATDPVIGACDAGAGDISGAFQMTSGNIAISSTLSAPRLAFDHYVATEAGWDGGNVKMSVNGGPYNLIPPTAFTFNSYNLILQTAGAGNTNPLAGQPGFSGTDGGQLGGSWGQSQVDLGLAGVAPGDTINLQYDMGLDGCNGLDGWYVDDVHVYTCEGGANVPPDCSGAVPSTSVLRNANGKFKRINVVGVTDPDGDPVAITVDSIFQDELVSAPIRGRVTAPDGIIAGEAARVRAERVAAADGGTGRVYHIGFTADDGAGGMCSGEVLVSVPIDRLPVVDEGALYDSTVP